MDLGHDHPGPTRISRYQHPWCWKGKPEWLAYGGPQACFGIAKLVVSQTDATPGYLEGGSNAVWASEDQAAGGAVLGGFTSGTHFARLEILRETWIGKVLVAHTDVATIVVP